MYIQEDKCFVMKKSTGELVNVTFKKPVNCILYNVYSNSSNIQSIEIPAASSDFSCCMDEYDNSYVLYRDTDNTVSVTLINAKSRFTFQTLKSKSLLRFPEHLNCLYVHGILYIFFIVENNGTHLLAHQTLQMKPSQKAESGSISVPVTIDNIIFEDSYSRPYGVVFDGKSDIYAFYSKSSQKPELGYKILKGGTWGNFTPLSGISGIFSNPAAIADRKNTLHLIFQIKHTSVSSPKHSLMYMKILPDPSSGVTMDILHSSQSDFNNASIALIDDIIYIYRVQNDQIFYMYSDSYGKTFRNYSRYSFPATGSLLCIKYFSNDSKDKTRIVSDTLPGTFSLKGINLAFVKPGRPITTGTSSPIKVFGSNVSAHTAGINQNVFPGKSPVKDTGRGDHAIQHNNTLSYENTLKLYEDMTELHQDMKSLYKDMSDLYKDIKFLINRFYREKSTS